MYCQQCSQYRAGVSVWLEETEVCLCNSSEQVLQSLFRSALTPHSPHTIHEIFDVTELSLFTKIYNKYIVGHSNGPVQSVVSIFSIKIHKLSVQSDMLYRYRKENIVSTDSDVLHFYIYIEHLDIQTIYINIRRIIITGIPSCEQK